MALLLIGIGHKISNGGIGAPLIFHRMSRNTLRRVPIGAGEDARTAFILSHPENAIVGLDRRGRSREALLDLSTLYHIIRKWEIAGVEVGLSRACAKNPQ